MGDSSAARSSMDVLDIITSTNSYDNFVPVSRNKSSTLNQADSNGLNILKKFSFGGSSLFLLSDEYKISDQLDRNHMMEEENNNRMNIRRRHSLFVSRPPMIEEECNEKLSSLGLEKDRRKSIPIFVSHKSTPSENYQAISSNSETSNTLTLLNKNPVIHYEEKLDSNKEYESNRRASWCNYRLEKSDVLPRCSSLKITGKSTFNILDEEKHFHLSATSKTDHIKGSINKKYLSVLSLLPDDLSPHSSTNNDNLPEQDVPHSFLLEVDNTNILQRRRSSVGFSVVEEFNTDLSKREAVHRIPSIDEVESIKANLEDEVNPNEDNIEIAYAEQQKSKPRSKSLYPCLNNATYESIMRLPSRELNSHLNGSYIRKHQRKQRLSIWGNDGYLNQYLNNLRSESVDSGFSCASISSIASTSSDSSIEPPKEYPRRSASMGVSSADSSKISIAETIDYPAWIKSLKKLVQLTKQLRSISVTEENKEKTMLAEISALRQMEHVKKFVRHNDWPVSHEIRADLWRVLCNSKDFDSNKLLFSQQLEDLTKSGVKTLRPSFLSMDGIVVHDHGLKEQGAVILQRLLIVIECVRPELRFVPVLYPLCAMFLHYMRAEETFACILRLLSQGHTFILQSELAVYASCYTLLSLLKKHKKSVYNMLKKRAGTSEDKKLTEIFSNWNAWIFKHMPFEFLVRIIDCFLVEGHKMLLRITLSLLYIWYKERLRDPSFSAYSSSTTNTNKITNTTTNSSGFPLLRSTILPKHSSKFSTGNGVGGSADGKSIDQRIAEINDQICGIAQNCPVSVQTLLDMGWAIRNFKHSTFENRQKHYEEKFRETISRQRSEKATGGMGAGAAINYNRTLYTEAFDSKIVNTEAAAELMCALPNRYQLETPKLLFRLSEHGASFVQLWTQIDCAEQSLLIIRSTQQEIFGAYCSSCWSERRDVRERAKTRYFGTGESMVWRLHPELQLPVVYPWAGQNSEHPDTCPQMFMTAGDRFLIIGSGGEGDAIAIREELTHGLSYPCDTFASPELATGNAFDIDELEVYMVRSTLDRDDEIPSEHKSSKLFL